MSILFYGADENPTGEYLTPQKSKQKVKDFWLGGSNPTSEASGNPTISAIKQPVQKDGLFLYSLFCLGFNDIILM